MLRYILSYITFPGVIAHEFAHAWACRRMGIRIHKICYLRFGNPLGYVLHDAPAYAIQHILVAVAPFFVSTVLSVALSLSACAIARYAHIYELRDILVILAVWCSFSFALHAFPSSGDGDALWDDVRSPDISLLAKLLLVPVVAVIRLALLGNRIWLDAMFAVAIVALPPTLLLVLTSG